jgi:hypothetical protein
MNKSYISLSTLLLALLYSYTVLGMKYNNGKQVRIIYYKKDIINNVKDKNLFLFCRRYLYFTYSLPCVLPEEIITNYIDLELKKMSLKNIKNIKNKKRR